MQGKHEHYYVPHHSYWPIIGSVGLALLMVGAANVLHEREGAWVVFGLGLLTLIGMMFGWFGDVIRESHRGLYSAQLDRSFRWGMVWFIFSEVMFFAAFFGALFYARELVVPWLGGEGLKPSTHSFLWPNFQAQWPLINNPDPSKFPGPSHVMSPWGIPALNTLLLLSSGFTLTIAHWALKANNRFRLNLFLLLTVILGAVFLCFQAYEYIHAYHELHLTLASGIYGSTFFMLTGFHGLHVTLGAIMLSVIFCRCLKGHFNPQHHFAFEAVSWYWHFVDVVWLLLFVLVYWL